MKSLYESILDVDDNIEDQSLYVDKEVENCFVINKGDHSTCPSLTMDKKCNLIVKGGSHYECTSYLHDIMSMKLINLKVPVTFDYVANLDFNGNTCKKDWNDNSKKSITKFKDVGKLVFQSNKGLPKWVNELNIDHCHLTSIYCELGATTYNVPRYKSDIYNISVHGTGLFQKKGEEIQLSKYKGLDTDKVTVRLDEICVKGILPFDSYSEANVIKIDKANAEDFDKFFANNKVNHLYVYLSDNAPRIRRGLYYEVLPARGGTYKLERTTLHHENFE